MRYLNIDKVSFTIDGKTVLVNDIRPILEYTTLVEIGIRQGDYLDEICTRRAIYSDDSENEVYKIFEHNAKELYDSNFELWKLNKLKIPNR